jgi:hypothetical protein
MIEYKGSLRTGVILWAVYVAYPINGCCVWLGRSLMVSLEVAR